MRRPGRKRRARSVARRTARFVAASLSVVLAIALPVAVLARHRSRAGKRVVEAAQPATVVAPGSAADVAAFEKWASGGHNALVILCYHGVRIPSPAAAATARDASRVSPAELDAQMAMLETAGFSPVSASQLSAFLRRGAPLPPKPVLITFDDATAGLPRYADPIIARFGFHAMAMVAPGRVDAHGGDSLTWRQLQQLRATGRWDIEAQSANGSGTVVIDAGGHRGPFMANREWLPGRHRLETSAEGLQRVASDVAEAETQLADHGFAAPAFFAYPFSEAGEATNDVQFARAVRLAVDTRFEASFVDPVPPRAVSQYDLAPGNMLPRVVVTGGESARALFDAIVAAQPLPLVHDPSAEGPLWRNTRNAPPDRSFRFAPHRIVIGGATRARAYFSPATSAHWADYQVSVRILGLSAKSKPSAAVYLLIGSGLPGSDPQARGRPSVTIRLSRVSVSVADALAVVPSTHRSVKHSDSHLVSARVTPAGVTVTIDGRVVYRGVSVRHDRGSARGGIGVGVSHGPAVLTFANLTVTTL